MILCVHDSSLLDECSESRGSDETSDSRMLSFSLVVSDWGLSSLLWNCCYQTEGAQDNIRNKIGSNSEKEFNNSKFLNDSEVESKASTPLFFEKDSSRSTKAGF